MAGFLALVPIARTVLYGVFIACSLLTFILGAALIGTTMADFGGYFQASAELLVAGLLGVAIVTPLHLLFHRRPSTHVLSITWVELVVLGVLNLLFLGGAAAMSNQLFGVSLCTDYSLCDLANALQAFSWLAWISSLCLIALVVVAALMENHPEIWKEQFAVGRTQEVVAKDKETPAEAGDGQMAEAQATTV